MPGVEEIQRNAAALQARVTRAADSAAGEIAALLESYAKTRAPFHDQTGNLRQSIHGDASRTSQDVYTVVLSAGMDYARFVELCNEGRYAYLWPAILANEARIVEIWRRRLQEAFR